MNEQINEPEWRINECMNEWMNKWMYEWMIAWMNATEWRMN